MARLRRPEPHWRLSSGVCRALYEQGCVTIPHEEARTRAFIDDTVPRFLLGKHKDVVVVMRGENALTLPQMKRLIGSRMKLTTG